MNEQSSKRREWVKTAAIVFLTVMLVLTFFSNTIMNYSLPEVAAQYVESGSITAKIRGNGVVESGDPYEVKVTETRKVSSVAVKVGDTVQKGDVLVYLAGQESEELKAAKEALEAAEKDYNLLLFTSSVTASDIYKANKDVTAESLRNQITKVQNELQAAKDAVTPLQTELDEIQASIDDFSAQITYETSLGAATDSRVIAAKNAMDVAQGEVNSAKANLVNVAKTAFPVDAEATADKLFEAGIKGETANVDALLQTVSSGDANAQTNVRNALNAAVSAQRTQNSAYTEYMDAVDEQNDRKGSQSISYLQSTKAELEIDLHNARQALTLAEKARDDKQKQLDELVASVGNVNQLEIKQGIIDKAREKVTELEEKANGGTVVADIAGTVTAINVVAGNNVSADTPVAVLQPEGRGYSLSFSVTNEQARRLSVGDVADLVNAWRYEDVVVTLASIKPDPAEPGQKKKLTFDVTGSIVAGQSLNISVGQKSANFDLIVPNSAIREDNNGKFILTVESKSSPLGNRYVATRVDVEVLASDDTKSAISGALYGYEFVITTSNKPVEAGQLIRLPE